MYVSKMLDIISDVTIFECISVPIDRYTKMRIKVTISFEKSKIVCDADVLERLFAFGSTPGVMYGLPNLSRRVSNGGIWGTSPSPPGD